MFIIQITHLNSDPILIQGVNGVTDPRADTTVVASGLSPSVVTFYKGF